MTNLYQFLSGASAFGCFAAATFFFKFRVKTGDVIFSAFSWGFAIFGLERILLVLDHAQSAEKHPLIYVVRLCGFAIILTGIVQKNRRTAP